MLRRNKFAKITQNAINKRALSRARNHTNGDAIYSYLLHER